MAGGMRRYRFWLAAAAVAIVIGALAFYGAARRPKPGWTSGDTLGVRLVGVRPDEGDAIYDAAGRKLRDDKNWSASDSRWSVDEMHRTFIFDLPDAAEDVILLPQARAKSGERWVGTGNTWVPGTRTPRRLLAFMDLRRSYSLGIPFLPLRGSVSSVDVTLSYFKGPRGKAVMTFAGPFVYGAKVTADAGGPSDVAADMPFGDDVRFKFSSTLKKVDWEQPWLAYDEAGRRYLMNRNGGGWGSGGASLDITVPELPLERIAFITFGETPQAMTFHDIHVTYRGMRDRTYPEYLDRMAEILALPDRSPEGLERYQLGRPEDVMKVIGELRGQYIQQAAQRLGYSKGLDPAKVDDATREKVRAVIREWVDSGDDGVALSGVTVGLRFGWDEFVKDAIALADRASPGVRAQAAGVIARRRELLGDDEYARLADMLLSEEDPRVFVYLLYVLPGRDDSQSATRAMARIAEDPRPWLWVPAMEWLHGRDGALGDPASWDMDLKARWLLVNGNVANEAERRAIEARANELLPTYLTGDLQRMNQSGFDRILRHTVTRLDREKATAAIIGYLRTLPPVESQGDSNRQASATIDSVRYLNELNGVNIGGLGKPSDTPRGGYDDHDLRQVAADAVAWYDTGVDPGVMPEGYRAGPGDLRIAWVCKDDREQSLLGIWPAPKDAAARPRQYRLDSSDSFATYCISPQPGGAAWYVALTTGIRMRCNYRGSKSLSSGDLPALVFPGPEDMRNLESSMKSWEIYVERADSPTSVLSGTKAFDEWWAKYGPEGVMTAPTSVESAGGLAADSNGLPGVARDGHTAQPQQ